MLGSSELLRLGSEHGEHHSELVLWQQPINAGVKLSVQNGRSGDPPLEPLRRPAAGEIPTSPHSAHTQGSRGQVLWVCVPRRG